MREVAVVGGGLAGAACAWRLSQAHGVSVTLFDLGRRAPGGRVTTKRLPLQPGASGTLQFDVGAQFFTASDPRVRAVLEHPSLAGCVAPWAPRLAHIDAPSGRLSSAEKERAGGAGDGEGSSSSSPQQPSGGPGFFGCLHQSPGHSGPQLYVGTPSMDALPAAMCASPGVTVRLGTRVAAAELDARGWRLWGGSGGGSGHADDLGSFDGLVLADVLCTRAGSPGYVAPQGEGAAAALAALSAGCDLKPGSLPPVPMFALMMAFRPPQLPALPFDAVSVTAGVGVAWLARDSSKPGRARDDSTECWVALATAPLSQSLLGDRSPSGGLPPQDEEYLEQRAAVLFGALQKDLLEAGLSLPAPVSMRAHRWGSAFVERPLMQPASDGGGGGTTQPVVPALVHAPARLAAVGDWVAGGGTEGAIVSGLAAADALVAGGLPKS
ncbi:hypothetical protein FOA52_016163 [Chlamydomonas sp. UWO 241]|nr:hypothetical protein FOA52_016163 [Chlamydomonas sp. UWO 241]